MHVELTMFYGESTCPMLSAFPRQSTKLFLRDFMCSHVTLIAHFRVFWQHSDCNAWMRSMLCHSFWSLQQHLGLPRLEAGLVA